MSAMEALMAANAGLMGVVAYFIRGVHLDMKDLAKATQQLGTVAAVHESRLSRVENELNAVRGEISDSKAETSVLRMLYSDLAGFLQGQGFKKRDG